MPRPRLGSSRPLSHRRAARLAAAVVASIVVAGGSPPAQAQGALGFGGAELRAGLVFVEDAEVGGGVFGEVDLGYVQTPPLRLLVGVSRFQANIDREPGGDEGSFTATGLWASGRYDLMRWRALAPYVRAGLTIQNVDADAFDQDVGALLDGVYLGVAGGLGARYLLDGGGRLAATAELRRTLINNVGNTALELGVRFQRLGWGAYAPDLALHAGIRPARPTAPGTAQPRAVPPVAPPAGPVDTLAERRLAELEQAIREAERTLVEMRTAPGAPAPEGPPPPVTVPPPDPEGAAAREAMLRQGLARAVAAMASLVDIQETDTHFMLTIQGNAFPTGAASLSRSARDEMRILGTALGGYPGHIVTVEGHTDAVGDPGANQRLSQERAAAVRAALVVEGVDPLWIGSRGFGAQRPIASNDSPAGRAANRRVEVRVAKQVCPTSPRPALDGTLECPPLGLP